MMAIGPKDHKVREIRADLGASLNKSNVDRALEADPAESEVDVDPPAGAYENNEKAAPAPAQPPPAPQAPTIDPLADCTFPSAYANRYRIEGGEMTVKLLFGEGVGRSGEIQPRSVIVMSLLDFQRFVASGNQIVLAYRTKTSATEKPNGPTEQV